MRLRAISKENAEEFIAGVWIAVEEASIPSPTVVITFHSDRVSIELRFEREEHEKIVSAQFSSWLQGMSTASAKPRA